MESRPNDPTPAIIRSAQVFQMAASWVAVEKLKDLTPEQALVRPSPNMNHIHWLIGHITVSSDIGPYINGSDRVIETSFDAHFDMGTQPKDDGSGYPQISEILANFEKGIDNSLSAIKLIEEEDLDRPPAKPLGEPLNQYFKTRYDIINGFATHIAYHGGQIGTILSLLEG